MLPSQMPSQRTRVWIFRMQAAASAAPWRAGSVTISRSGVPARLRSIPVALPNPSCTERPASSSRWARTSPMPRRAPPSGSTVIVPPTVIGSSYWLIW